MMQNKLKKIKILNPLFALKAFLFALIVAFYKSLLSLMLRYIPQDKQIHLKEFKYQGGSASLTYEYLWSPFAEFLLKFTPQWIAPNLITLVAFFIVIISHFIFMFWGEDQLGKPIPPWKGVLMCLTIFVYQHLDNMDGKQARRTKNSTPVGMLFDHGADAITAVLFGVQIIVLFGIKNQNFSIFLVVYMVLYPNFAGIWNQYSIGHFKLDRINPIDQGLPTYSLFALGGAFFNYFNFFNEHHWFAKWNEEIILGISISIGVIVLGLHRDLIKNPLIRGKQDIAMKILLPTILISALCVWHFYIDENIFVDHFYPIFYILTFMWGRNMMLMQVSYVTKQRFHSLNIGTITFLIIWAASSLMYIEDFSTDKIHNFMIFAAVVQLLVLIEFIIGFLVQAKRILGIHIFRINLPKPQTKTQ